MVIERKYVRLKKLYMTDPLSKAVIEKAFSRNGEDISDLHVWKANARTTLFNASMGCCIPKISVLVSGFEELDKTNPYDNGKTIYDIDHSVVLGWKKDGTVILIHCDKKGNIITISETRPEAGKESQWREEEVTLNSDVFQD